MPSPEYHYQRCAETPTPSPQLQAVITDLAEYHEVDLTQAGALFTFTRPQQDTHWVISNYQGKIDVARCPVASDDFMVPDIDVLLAVTPEGWQTEKVIYTPASWHAYAQATAEQGQPLAEPPVEFPFFAFAEYVAQLIAAEAQLEQASDAEAVKAWLTLE
jgi:hypothetical protein